MPRPRPAVSSHWSCRVTPADQQEIMFETLPILLKDTEAKIIVAQEGNTDDVQLHYHLYINTNASESTVRNTMLRLSRGTGGNKAYSVKPITTDNISGCIGYTVKDGCVVYRHHYTDQHIEEFITASAQYRLEFEASRKRALRGTKNYLQQVIEEVEKLTPRPDTPSQVYHAISQIYDRDTHSLPNRSLIELTIVNFIGGEYRSGYYLKNIT